MISDAQQIPPPSFLWKPSLIPLPSAHAELSRVPNGLEFTWATARTELTGRARESIDANHWETSTKNDTGSASEVLGYAWAPLQPNCGRSLEVSSRSVSAAKKRAIWEYKGVRYVIHTSPQCCGTELAQLTCCQSMKVIIPSETKCIIKMQILGALNGWWITCHIVMALISQPVIKVLG